MKKQLENKYSSNPKQIVEQIIPKMIEINTYFLNHKEFNDTRIQRIKKELLEFYSRTPIEIEYRSTYLKVFEM